MAENSTVSCADAHVLVGRDDGHLGLYNSSTGECVTPFEGHTDWILALDVDWTSMRAVSAGSDGAIFSWDLATGSGVDLTQSLLIDQCCVRGCVRALAVDWIDSKDTNGEECEDKHSVAFKGGPPSRKQSLANSPVAGKRASVMSHSPSLSGISRSPSKSKRKNPVLQTSSISRALSGSDDGRLVLWDLNDNRVEKVYEFQFHLISALAVEWSRLRTLIGHGERGLDLYDLEQSCCLRSFSGHTCLVTVVNVNWIKSLALCGSGDGTLLLWDVRKTHHVQALKGNSGGISTATVHWQSMRALTGGSDHSVRLWNMKHGSCTRIFSAHEHPIRAIAVDWSTGFAITASASGVGGILLWALGETVEQPGVLELQSADQKASTSVLELQVKTKQVVVEAETT